jgi:hypothetical protein
MTNIPQQKTDPQLVANLQSNKEEMVIKTLNDLRFSGSAAYLPLLTDIWIRTGSSEVKNNIRSIFGELKDKSCIPVMISLIEDITKLPVKKELLAACWQNGMDFSPYLAKFVDWVIETEMDIAFEAFTVIENLDYYPDKNVREAEIVKINRALQNADSLKSYLLKELRGTLA